MEDQPLRLLRRRGHWALEVTRMVPVDRHVLRPERRRVSGADSVVRHLKERCAPTLVREALDLIVGQDDGFDRAFELEGEHWVQVDDEQPPHRSSGSAIASLTATVSELRAELTSMRALHEALRSRLAHLERRITTAPPLDYGRAATRPSPRREPAVGSLRPGAARTRQPPPDAAADVVAATEIAATALAPAPVAEPVAKATLTLPLHADVATCLKQLLGADPELRHERAGLPKDLSAFFVARVIDTTDQELGAILFDKQAGLELGGRLLGFPPSAVAEQLKEELSTDMLDAMNEVVNNLSGFINRANLDIRVHVCPLQKCDPAALPWLEKCPAHLGSVTKNGGRLWLAGK
jgi:hypothetical protein